MNRTAIIGVIAVFTLGIGVSLPVNAQRIGIEDTPADTQSEDAESRKNTSQETAASSNRIIPPEEFGKYRNQQTERSDLSKDALIEKLQADSASMRIRFREKMRELKADSRSMRRTIRKLRRENRRLSRKLGRIGGSGTSIGTGGETRGPDTPATPDFRSSDRTEPKTTGQPGADTDGQASPEKPEDADTGETEPSENITKLNPNTASLSDLKSISGLSDRLAERIEWYRREVRPFQNRQDLRRVPGIDRGTFDRIKEHFHEGPY